MSHLVLKKLSRFITLSEADRQLFISHAQHVEQFDARRDLVDDGDNPRYVNLILEGWACRYKQLEDGRRQIISFFVPGDMCDPVVFLLREMSHALGSITPVTVARLSREQMAAMMTASPALERLFWFEMLASAEIQREWTVNLGRRTALERMAHLFCELSLRLKIVGLSDGAQCEAPLTQADLADALGLSAVHVSRTLQELRNSGLVDLKARRLTIYDEAALRDLAKFDPTYLHVPELANL